MLWGIDVNDYPQNSKIWFGNEEFKLSVKHQTIEGFVNVENYPFSVSIPPDTIYPFMRQYLFFNDSTAVNVLENYKRKAYQKNTPQSEIIDEDVMSLADFQYMIYNSVIFLLPDPYNFYKYIDEHSYYGYEYGLYKISSNPDCLKRTSDIRSDLLVLYIQNEQKKGRVIGGNNLIKDNCLDLGFDLDLETGYVSFTYLRSVLHSYKNQPWFSYSTHRGICTVLSFLIQLKHKIQNKVVVEYMSGKRDYQIEGITEGGQTFVRESLLSNNYYGYTLLREFCENPMRETPILEKIGT
ncbi:hypothetical protein D0T60_08755, partial [Bacteroides sp. 224]|nr:hypothetical protein [Bacteroides sp. 224]